MNADFNSCFDRTVGIEGGYVFNSRDPGGETKFGISKRSYPTLDIKNLTRETAKLIYQRDFWGACGVGLSDAHRFMVFDAAVNHGIGNAIRMMQRAVKVADDGHWGPRSQSSYISKTEWDVGFLFLAERIDFMTKLSTFDEFGRGWSRRIGADLRFAAEDI